MSLQHLRRALRKKANPQSAKGFERFFKTGPGGYGEGDKFLGLSVPMLHEFSKQFLTLSIRDISVLLESKLHEERLVGLLILVKQYKKADMTTQKKICAFYLKNAKRINNWDLVDSSAHHIVGHYLSDKNKAVLYRLAKSTNLWERRIAIVSTWYFIRQNQLDDTFKISKLLLNDNHDLIHKASGWMLREAGKRDLKKQEKFLKMHYQKMPRTMLRYAIEKFPESKRKAYLAGSI